MRIHKTILLFITFSIFATFPRTSHTQLWEKRLELSQLSEQYEILRAQIETEQQELDQKLELIQELREQIGEKGENEAIFNMAEVFFDHKFYDEALEIYESLLEKEIQPTIYAEILYKIIFIYYQKREFDTALSYHSQLLRYFPNSQFAIPASYIAALCHYQLDSFDGAIDACQLIPETHKLFSYAQYLQGFCFLQKDDLKNAEYSFKHSLLNVDSQMEKAELRDKSHLALGQIYRFQQDYENALKQFQKIPSGSDQYDEALFAIGWLFMEIDEAELAIKNYSKLIEKFPDGFLTPFAQLAIGHTYLRNDEYDLARDMYKEMMFQFSINQKYFLNEESELLRQLQTERELLVELENGLVRLQNEARNQTNPKLAAHINELVRLQEREIETLRNEIRNLENSFLGVQLTKERKYWIDQLSSEKQRLEETLNQLENISQDTFNQDLFIQKNQLYQLHAEISFLKNWYNFEEMSRQKQFEEAKFGHATALFELYRERKVELMVPLLRYKAFWTQHPDSRFAADALYRTAELYFQQEDQRYSELREIALEEDAEVPTPSYKNAIDHYQTLVEQYPESEFVDDALYGLGYCLYEQREENDAIQVFRSLVENFPDSPFAPEAHLRIGEYQFEKDKMENALQSYQNVVFGDDIQNGFSEQALYKLGWCYYRLTRYEDAIATFSFMVEDDYYSPTFDMKQEALDQLVKTFMSYDEVDEKVRQFFIEAGRKTYALTVIKKIAESYKLMNDCQTAIEMYEIFLSLYPDHPQAPNIHFQIVECYETLNDTKMANVTRLEIFQKYNKESMWQKKNVLNNDALVYADSLTAQAIYEIASYHHNMANQLKTNDSVAAEKQFWLAVDAYFHFLEYFPRNPLYNNASFYYADCLLEVGEYYKAVAEYQGLLNWKNDKFKCDIRYNLALGYDRILQESSIPQTDLQDSLLNASRRFIHECPDDNRMPEILFKEGEIYYEKKNFENAHIVYSFLEKNYPKNERREDAKMMAALSSYQAGNRGEALAQYEEIYENSRDAEKRREAKNMMVTIIYELAKTYQNDDKLPKAAEVLVNFAQSHNEFSVADTMLYDAAKLYEKGNYWTDALKTYKTLLKEQPQSILYEQAYINTAICYENLDRWDYAADVYENYAKNYTDNPVEKLIAFCDYASALQRSDASERDKVNALRSIINRAQEIENAYGDVFDKPLEYEQCAAKSYFEMGELTFGKYAPIELIEPLEKNFQRKQTLMDACLEYYMRSATYGIAQWTIPSLYRLGNVYQNYALSIWESERPKGELSEDELMEYNFVLEDTAFTYTQTASEIYESLLQKAREAGIENEWTKRAEENLKKIEAGNLLDTTTFEGNGHWLWSANPQNHWAKIYYDESEWNYATTVAHSDTTDIINLKSPQNFIWGDTAYSTLYFRYSFPLGGNPLPRQFGIWIKGDYEIYINEYRVVSGSNPGTSLARILDITDFLNGGKNVIAIKATHTSPKAGMLIKSDVSDITPKSAEPAKVERIQKPEQKAVPEAVERKGGCLGIF